MIEITGKGGISAKIIADSISDAGDRITTVQLKYPRFIHGELMTHRLFSRNASSSRAIPVQKLIDQVSTDPAMPIHWGKNQRGMQANEEVEYPQQIKARWLSASRGAVNHAKGLMHLDVHKQIVNRILEPFQFMHTLVTATEWENFFALRIHKDAQPEINELASCMFDAMGESEPYNMLDGWHLPYISEEDLEADVDDMTLVKASAARCARVSYLNHDQSKPSIEKDLELYNMLAVRPFDDGKGHVLGDDDPVHLSPLEHQAKPMEKGMDTTEALSYFVGENFYIDDSGYDGVTAISTKGELWSGNFKGWVQYRQLI